MSTANKYVTIILIVLSPSPASRAWYVLAQSDAPPARVAEQTGHRRLKNRDRTATPTTLKSGEAAPYQRAAHSAAEARLEKRIYRVELTDPASPSTPARIYDVVQSRDRDGFPVEYALSFETRVCPDNQCKIVVVTMVWNAVGYVQRLECPPDKPLTKKDHVPFTAEDSAKLDRILKDRNSILANWTLAFLDQPTKTAKDIDAVTSPTPITVQDAVVQDAAYTSWALWHWANGTIVPKLRSMTEQSCTPAYLNHLLVSDDPRYVDFALDYVMDNHTFDSQFVDSILHILENGDRDQITRSLEFLSHAIPDKQKLHAQLIDSCCRMRPANCPMILRKLASEPNLPPSTLEGLTGRLAQLPYFPIHLILRMLEEREFVSEKTIADISSLLDSDDFFIARRAYEYLAKQDLNANTRKKANAFYHRNHDRL